MKDNKNKPYSWDTATEEYYEMATFGDDSDDEQELTIDDMTNRDITKNIIKGLFSLVFFILLIVLIIYVVNMVKSDEEVYIINASGSYLYMESSTIINTRLSSEGGTRWVKSTYDNDKIYTFKNVEVEGGYYMGEKPTQLEYKNRPETEFKLVNSVYFETDDGNGYNFYRLQTNKEQYYTKNSEDNRPVEVTDDICENYDEDPELYVHQLWRIKAV